MPGAVDSSMDSRVIQSKNWNEVSNSESLASLCHVTMGQPLVPHYVAL